MAPIVSRSQLVALLFGQFRRCDHARVSVSLEQALKVQTLEPFPVFMWVADCSLRHELMSDCCHAMPLCHGDRFSCLWTHNPVKFFFP